MPYNVTSWFNEQTLLKTPNNLVRKFTIGTSDYSDRVIKWPTFKTSWNDIRPMKLKMLLANGDTGMNFLREDKTLLRQESKIEFGYTHATSGDELITLFSGTPERVRYSKERTEIVIVDKFRQLTERVMGSGDAPIDYTGSSYLPADIAWYAITSYGGFDTTKSSANVDIDYDSWLTWSNVFSADAVLMKARLDGQKVSEVLRKIGKQTLSAVYISEARLTFHRFSTVDTAVTSFDNSVTDNLTLEFNDSDIINKQYVAAGFSVVSDYSTITVEDASTSSINSFGLREDLIEDEKVWYANSGSAINLAQRVIQIEGEPFDDVNLETYLNGFTLLVGDTISVVDSFHSIDDLFRVMDKVVNVDKGSINIGVDRSQFDFPFILDTSTLGSFEVLT